MFNYVVVNDVHTVVNDVIAEVKNLIGSRVVFVIIGAIHNCRSKKSNCSGNILEEGVAPTIVLREWLGIFWRSLLLFGNIWEYFGGIYCCLGIVGNIWEYLLFGVGAPCNLY